MRRFYKGKNRNRGFGQTGTSGLVDGEAGKTNQIGDLGLVGIANDIGDAGECGEIFGSALGVAAGDEDACSRITGMNLANGVASLGIGGRGYGAGVDDHEIGRFSRR